MHFFKPFGCKVWALKPKVNRESKFAAISWEGTLVGYANDYSTCRILHHDDRKFTYLREVQFGERNFLFCQPLNKSLNV
jgi:hypothetical protein